ncbi:unnamed protein product [Rotaria sordida]|uniref:Uncharacterized protein n=1 Tax=Rotaria sordida TaxID=392033 RepID=A0A814PCP1_9BILA|nr:unnamed protein product [Rotaria sordida]CAF1105969.1 unnamed protein product [Rotaria sordida]
MLTQKNDQRMQINNHRTIDKEKYDNSNRFNTSQNDVYMNNIDKMDWNNGIDFGNMVTIKKKQKNYLKSGTGQLIIQSKEQLNCLTNLHVWPKEIKIIIKQKSIKMNATNENDIYINFISNKLHELDNQLKQYQTELNQKIISFYVNPLELQQLIETYIQQNLSSFRMEIEHKIELIHYDYYIQALKLEYYRYNPNEYQKQLMKQLCCSKYEQEITKQEYNLLQQQISYYNSSCHSFKCSPISQSELIDSIQDPNIRQELFNQYKEIAEQSKQNMLSLYLKSAKIQMDECNKKFDADMKKLWHDRRSSCDNEKISPVMIDLIEQRCNKIGDRIRCIYIFKAKSICVKDN